MSQDTAESNKARGSRVAPSGAARAVRWLVAYIVLVFAAVAVLGTVLVVQVTERNARAAGSEDVRVPVFKAMLKQNPGDLDARRQLAFAYQQQRRDRDALREYDRVLEREPSDIASLYNSGLVCLHLDKDDEGEARLSRVLELEPGHALASRRLAEHYARNQDFRAVLAVAVPAADGHPEMADLQYLAGLGLEKTGSGTEALAHYKRALKLVPAMSNAAEAVQRLEATER